MWFRGLRVRFPLVTLNGYVVPQFEINMKTAIIVVVMWYLVLEFWVRNAENKSKAFEEERQKELDKRRKEREEWAKRYRY